MGRLAEYKQQLLQLRCANLQTKVQQQNLEHVLSSIYRANESNMYVIDNNWDRLRMHSRTSAQRPQKNRAHGIHTVQHLPSAAQES